MLARKTASLILAATSASSIGFAQAELYATDFASADGWEFAVHHPQGAATPSWNVDALPVSSSLQNYRSAPYSLNFNHDQYGLPDGSWNGTALSPPVDLSPALADPELRFWYAFQAEGGCNVWAQVYATIKDADTGAVVQSTCFSATVMWGAWTEIVVPLERAWGEVQIELQYLSSDSWNNGYIGMLVDDLNVIDPHGATVHCEGNALSGGEPGATLTLSGEASISSGRLRLLGAGFPTHTFATAFAGTAPGSIIIGDGLRCISAAGSRRLAIAPTRAGGAPRWNLDLGSAPLDQIAMVGVPLYVQTIFRDGASVNLSSTLRFTPAP